MCDRQPYRYICNVFHSYQYYHHNINVLLSRQLSYVPGKTFLCMRIYTVQITHKLNTTRVYHTCACVCVYTYFCVLRGHLCGCMLYHSITCEFVTQVFTNPHQSCNHIAVHFAGAMHTGSFVRIPNSKGYYSPEDINM